MFVFATRMLRDKLKSLIIYVISAVGFLEMYIALFPAISKQASQFNQILKTMPAELFRAMNIDPSTLSFSNLESFLSTEYMSFIWPIMAIVFAISLANYISVNEIDKGTIEILMALPSSRIKIFLQRYFAGLLLLATFCLISLWGIVPLAALQSLKYNADSYLTTTIGSFFFIWAVYSLAVLFSTIFSEKGKASMASGGILILAYALNIVASLQDNLQNLKYVSFFHYFNAPDLLARNIYPDLSLIVLGGFALVITFMAAMRFNSRDLSV